MVLAIADMAGGDWPRLARDAAVTLVTHSKTGTPSLGIRLLADIRIVFGKRDQMRTEQVLEELNSMEESPWGDIRGKALDSRGLANRLRKFDVKPRTIRTSNGTAKGYTRESLHDAWQRYLAPEPAVAYPQPKNVTSETSETGTSRA